MGLTAFNLYSPTTMAESFARRAPASRLSLRRSNLCGIMGEASSLAGDVAISMRRVAGDPGGVREAEAREGEVRAPARVGDDGGVVRALSRVGDLE
jgi:hypothetical protein